MEGFKKFTNAFIPYMFFGMCIILLALLIGGALHVFLVKNHLLEERLPQSTLHGEP